MAVGKKAKLEGFIEIEGPEIAVICGFCGKPNRENLSLEFNFKDKKIYCYCPECKRMNEMELNKDISSPLPKTKISR